MMVELKNIAAATKAKGSPELKKSLLPGDIRMIAEHFGMPYVSVNHILGGRYFGDKDVVECANRIVEFYNKIDLHKNVNQILESYEPIN